MLVNVTVLLRKTTLPTVRVSVTDAKTGAPIAGASVSVFMGCTAPDALDSNEIKCRGAVHIHADLSRSLSGIDFGFR